MTTFSLIKFLIRQPRFVYILEFILGAYIMIELAFQSQLESVYLFRFIIFYVCLLVLYNMTSSFLNVFSLMKNVYKSHLRKKVRFYIQIVPFVPAIVGTTFVFLIDYFKLNYFSIYRFVITLALVWIMNFSCGMFLAHIIGIPALISFDKENANVQ